MLIQTTQLILNFEGQPVLHPSGQPATFRSLAIEALIFRLPSDDGSICYANYTLAKRINNWEEVVMEEWERKALKERLGNHKHFNALVLGRMFDIIDGKEIK